MYWIHWTSGFRLKSQLDCSAQRRLCFMMADMGETCSLATVAYGITREFCFKIGFSLYCSLNRTAVLTVSGAPVHFGAFVIKLDLSTLCCLCTCTGLTSVCSQYSIKAAHCTNPCTFITLSTGLK